MLIGYARVSTHDQRLDLQLDALHHAGCTKIFTEKASGVQRDRPALKDALHYMRKGDTLVVWKMDRLARSLKHLLETIDHLETFHMGLRSLTEAIDTTTSGGKLIFHIFASLAEFERAMIQERTCAGLIAAKKLGRLGGRPKKIKEHDILVAKALLKEETLTVVDVAKRLQVSVATLYRHIPGGKSHR